MYNVSSGFQTSVKQANRTISAKVVIGANTYLDDNIVSIDFNDTSNPDTDFEIGTVASASMNLKLLNVTESFETSTYQPYIGVLVNGVTEWVPLGKFYADKVSKNKGIIEITLYDGMIKLEQAYFSNLTYPATITDVMNEICTKTGVTFSGTLPAYSLATKPEGFKYREVVSIIAQLCGGFAKFDRSGNLTIKYYAASTETITTDNYVQDGFQPTKDVPYRIDQINIDVTNKTVDASGAEVNTTTTITKGAVTAGGSILEFSNNFATDAIATDIYNRLNGFSFTPSTIQAQGNPATEVGDIITFTDDKGNTYQFPVMKIDLTYSGGLLYTLEAVGESENKNQFDTSGSMANTVNRVVNDLALINTALINKATIDDLNATNARITNLIVTTAMIDDLAVTNAKIANAAVDTAQIANAAVGNAQIDRATANKLIVVTADIADAAITNAKIDRASVDKLVVTTADIEDAAITSAKIGQAEVDTANIKSAAITTALIATGAVGTEQVADSSITSAKIVSLNADVINAGTLSVQHLLITGADSIVYEINAQSSGLTSTQLTDTKYQQYLNGTVIVAKSITASQIAAQTITANELVVGTITAASGIIADAAITSAKIADLAVTGAKIADATITDAKITGLLSASKIKVGANSTFDAGYDPTKIQVGGTNLYHNSSREQPSTRFLQIMTYDILAPYIGQQICVSFDIQAQYARQLQAYPYQNNGISIADSYYFTPTTDKFTRVSFVTTAKDWGNNNASYTAGGIGIYDYAGNNNYTVKNIQIELGNKPTSWSPNPSDPAQDTLKVNGTDAATVASNASAGATAKGYFRSDGTLDVSKLYGQLSDAAIASAAKWNGQGTYIDGNGVYTGNILASQVLISDFTNYSIEGHSSTPKGYLSTSGGYFLINNRDNYLNNLIPYQVQNGDQFLFTVRAKNSDSGNAYALNAYIFVRYSDNSIGFFFTKLLDPTNTWTTAQVTVSISNLSTTSDVIGFYPVLQIPKTSGATSSNNWLVESIDVRRKSGGNLIVDGAITASKIAANSITADKLNVSQLSAIAADLGTVTSTSTFYDGSYYNVTAKMTVGSGKVNLHVTRDQGSTQVDDVTYDWSGLTIQETSGPNGYLRNKTYITTRTGMYLEQYDNSTNALQHQLHIYTDSTGSHIAADDYIINLGGPMINTQGGSARWQQSNTNYIIQTSTGEIDFYMGGAYKHVFWPDGTKSGGSIVIDGHNLGMSPIDSPQILMEYIEFDVALTAEGTTVYLEDRFRKGVDNFAAFPNNGTIIAKGDNYFTIAGSGVADIRIVGKRTGFSNVFFANLDGTPTQEVAA